MTADQYKYPISEYNTLRWAPSVPEIEIIVPNFRSHSVKGDLRMYRASMKGVRTWRITMRLFFVIYNCGVSNKFTHFEVFIMRYEDYYDSVLLERISHVDWSNIKMKAMAYLDQKRNNEKRFWHIRGLGDKFGPASDLRKLLLDCVVEVSSAGLPSIAERSYKMQTAQAHILHILMGNFTYNVFGRKHFNHPGNLGPTSSEFYSSSYVLMNLYEANSNISVLPLMLLSNTLLNFRFVVTVDRGSKGHEFHHLINAFGLNVWMPLIVTFLLVTVSISKLRSEFTVNPWQRSVTEVFQLLVEQGTPFGGSVTTPSRNRFVLAGVLLTGIIFSNAYENVNVYKMTRSRDPLRYGTLRELVLNNFTFCSRVGRAGYYLQDCSIYKADGKQFFHFGWERATLLTWATRRSDRIMMKFGCKIDFVYFLEYPQVDQNKLKVPGLFVTAVERLNQIVMDSLDYVHNTAKILDGSSVLMVYDKLEEEALLQQLQTGTKTAVLLPEGTAMKFIRMFRQYTSRRMDIGSEITRALPMAIRYAGQITRSHMQRIRVIHHAGIMSRWEKMYGFDFKREASYERQEVTAAQLSGNIFVIFVLNLTGICLAAVVLFLEVYGTALFASNRFE